ncbi:MAG: DNA-binding protein WhiA [Candidatus Riflebacteria bacterium]|nr:DNA-binding protein WhiA [Candidatus Riflebacteria bacterium]
MAVLFRNTDEQQNLVIRSDFNKILSEKVKKILPAFIELQDNGKVRFSKSFDSRLVLETNLKPIISQEISENILNCARTFLKSIFFSRAYVQNPKKGYHLEIMINSKVLRYYFRLSCKVFGITFKKQVREKTRVFYLKSGHKIAKFLNVLELFERAMTYEDLIATKSMVSAINRQVNFETANINKQVSASEKLCDQIKLLLDYPNQSFWTDSLKQVALLRMNFPHDSYESLGKRLVPRLSKSAVNHRLRRISECYSKIFGAE